MLKIYRIGTRSTLTIVLIVFAHFFGGAPLSANDVIGQRFEVRTEDLDQPFQTPSVGNRSVVVERPPQAAVQVPAGFEVNAFAENLSQPRWMAVAENGDVFLTEKNSDSILLLRDSDNDGVADIRSVYTSGLEQPHGLAIYDGYLYIGEVTQIRRVPYEEGVLQAPGPVETVTPPGSLGEIGGHWTRNITIGPDGKHFYVAVGSLSNRDVEPAPRGTIQRFAIDGTDQTTFASGLRNPVGIAFYPGTDDLYVVVNERDELGDGLVPDYLTRVEEGGFYGWPFVYLGHFVDPMYEDQEPSLIEGALEPDVLFKAHSAPLGLVFYDAGQFPEQYFGDAFVAFHGSWNTSEPTGYKIVHVPFENDRPKSYYENFAVGFRLDQASWLDGIWDVGGPKDFYRWMRSWFDDNRPAQVWGRPAGLVIATDGSLLIADDAGGTVWRISYKR